MNEDIIPQIVKYRIHELTWAVHIKILKYLIINLLRLNGVKSASGIIFERRSSIKTNTVKSNYLWKLQYSIWRTFA